MKRMNFLKTVIGILWLCCQTAAAQVPQVEKTLDFAGMKLRLTDQARRDIQSSVDALYRSEKHFNIMLERVDLYLPLIEPIFEEYGVPDEFKYLVIQESSLVPDAVSSSNAVGFWQFKEGTATELNMRVDRQVDERMNIISATEGAAKYFLRSNAEFDNWLLSLQSYLTGQGGTSRSTDKRLFGAREMKVDEDTHWYVKKFLAYMVAFQEATGSQNRNIILYQYTNTGNKTLRHIAREFDTSEEELAAYNKWLKSTHIPDDKPYSVIIPLNIDESRDLLAENDKKKKEKEVFGHKQQGPGKIPAASGDKLVIVEFNDLKGVVAREGDDVKRLADMGDLSEKKFRKYNDLEAGDKIQPGQIYYLERKHRKARMYEHVLQPGESLWQISQQYGLRLDKLLQKNRLRSMAEEVKPGQVLWLRFIRPRYEPVVYREVKAPKENLYASTKKKIIATSPQPAPAEKQKAKEQPVKDESNKPKEPAAYGKVIAAEKTTVAAGAEKSESKKPLPPEEKLLFPAEQEESKPMASGTTAPVNADKIVVVQKDTTRTQPSESKVQKKSEENTTADESWETPDEVFGEKRQTNTGIASSQKVNINTGEAPAAGPRQGEPAKKAQAARDKEESSGSDEFSADGPVNFVEERPEKTKQPKENAKQPQYHKVNSGETLYALSRQYNVSVQELIKWNNLPAQPVLSVGQSLRVSPPEEAKPTPQEAQLNVENTENPQPAPPSETEKSIKYHTVSAGESMYRVARMYNVTIKDIMQWNNKDNFDIREGEQLIVGKPQ